MPVHSVCSSFAALVLSSQMLCSCCNVPLEMSPAETPPEEELRAHGIGRPTLTRAFREKWGVAVVRIKEVVVDPQGFPSGRFVTYYFEPLKIEWHGEHRWPKRPMLPEPTFIHFPDRWRFRQGKTLMKEQAYVVFLERHLLGKEPMLRRAVAVSGLDAPLVLQLEAWLQAVKEEERLAP